MDGASATEAPTYFSSNLHITITSHDLYLGFIMSNCQ